MGKSGLSDAAVARRPGRDRATVWRGVRRNSGERGYRHAQARRRSEARRCAAPSVPRRMTPELWRMVEERLAEGWSPERISGRLRKEGEPMAGRQWIQRHVHADRKAGGRLWRHLRRRGRRPNRKGGAHAGRGHIPGRADIPERPAVVEARARVGDREADTIVGAGTGGAVVSLVDRATKYALPPRLDGKTAAAVGAAMTGMPGSLPVHTVTAGNGKEFAGHAPRPGGAGRGLPPPAAPPLVGARPDRAHQRPGAGIPAQGHGLPESGGRGGEGRPGPAQRASQEGAGLPDAGGGVPSGAASLRKTPDAPRSTRRGPSPARPRACRG